MERVHSMYNDEIQGMSSIMTVSEKSMTPYKLHADEFPLTVEIVTALIANQFPAWAQLPLHIMETQGTNNLVFTLGEDKIVRLPRMERAVPSLQKEAQWLPLLGPRLPIPIPKVIAASVPAENYPYPWLICECLSGTTIVPEHIDMTQAATDLGKIILALHKIETDGAPPCRRGKPLSSLDEPVRDAMSLIQDIYELKKLTKIWNNFLKIPPWTGEPVWMHGDLHPGNLLMQDSRISAVVDFGLTGTGDPATDLMVAWTILSPEARSLFKSIIKPDAATWRRAQGRAFSFGLIGYSYYRKKDPAFASISQHALDAVIAAKK